MMPGNLKKDLYPDGAAPSSYKRPQRVADMIRNEIALLLVSATKDPRLSKVSLTKVSMSKDLRRAHIFYSVFGDEEEVRKAGEGLKKARGFIRSHLARQLKLRVTPELVFSHDLSMVHQEEMERLFKEIGDEEKPTG